MNEPPEPLSASELAALPVFPLPRAVFFPGSTLPLHLFEPRYRALAEHCISEGPKAMAIALLEPGYEADYEGRPPIHRIAGAGRIIAHEQNPDGTHDVILHGTQRVALDEVDVSKPFRLAKATALVSANTTVPKGDVLALFSCASRVAEVVRRRHPEFNLGVTPGEPAAYVADILADRFVAEPDRRQAILEALDPAVRVALVTESIGELLLMLAEQELPS